MVLHEEVGIVFLQWWVSTLNHRSPTHGTTLCVNTGMNFDPISFWYSIALYYLGGKLAYFFGISTPEWQYAIDAYEDMKRKVSSEHKPLILSIRFVLVTLYICRYG